MTSPLFQITSEQDVIKCDRTQLAMVKTTLHPFILYTGFLAFLGFGVLNPIMPTLVGLYGGTAWEVGLLYAAYSLAQFLTLPGIGCLSDVYGRRFMMLVSLFGASLGYFIFGSGGALALLFAGWLIVGLTDGTASMVFAAIADSTTHQQRTRAFSWVSAMIALGLIIGPILSGVMSGIHPSLPVYVVAIAFFVALVWGYFAMPETLPPAQRSPKPSFAQLNPFTQLQACLALPHLRWLMFSFLIVNMAMFALISNLPALANEQFNWQASQIAPLFALFGVISVFDQAIIIPWLLPRWGEVRMAFYGALITGLAFTLSGVFAITGSVMVLYISIVLVGIGQPLAETSLIGLMSKSVGEKTQGRINSNIQTVQALARMIAPLLAGWLYQNISPSTPYWLSAAQILVAAVAVKLSVQKSTMSTQNNTVLITGGSSGIGLALARKFLQENNTVIITGRNPQKLADVKKIFPDIITEVADLNDFNALQQLVNRYPNVNILINNAGIQYNYEFINPEIKVELIETELRTNLIAPLQLIKLMLPHLLTKKEAAIVNVSSGLGLVPKQSAPVYCGSKAGLHIATKALRWQLETTSIKVFEIIAPLVDTPMTQGRGKGKISPDALVDEFWDNFTRDGYEMRIGKTKLLFFLQRWFPQVAEKILRPGL
ncbi:short-chain dehydrogenase, teichoic and lipoteichoic acid D-alanine esterification [Nostoc sp. PCC 7524]|uniref:MFS transporter n=1 Tax=Nostoc sp. (strain ATCC 29411 / PCC 7524) TaxID=28072 RepID=UPI00029F02F6|nr:MFS transporter [Nostoc sp. PCC 7524]AFY48367.1 short-chain dehydrogenase, teichoic and lipoteichoic acid D-alanine esterification [Nostoc sp. PCC 7524]